MKIVDEFKEFINRGNVIDLAVGVIIGGAFTSIVTSLTDDIISPILGMLTGGINLSDLTAQIGSATLTYGAFLQAIINFFIIALVVFFMVKAINKATSLAARKKEAEEAAQEEQVDETLVTLQEIRDLLKKDSK